MYIETRERVDRALPLFQFDTYNIFRTTRETQVATSVILKSNFWRTPDRGRDIWRESTQLLFFNFFSKTTSLYGKANIQNRGVQKMARGLINFAIFEVTEVHLKCIVLYILYHVSYSQNGYRKNCYPCNSCQSLYS